MFASRNTVAVWRSRHTQNTATPAGAMNAFTAVEKRGDPRAPPPLRLGRRADCTRRRRPRPHPADPQQ